MNMHRTFRLMLAVLLLVMGSPVVAQDATPEATDGATALPDRVVASYEGLFPEGVEYDAVNGRFLLSSTSEGTVFAVSDDGEVTPFVQDERIPSSFGLEVDEASNRLLVVASDQQMKGFLGIYDLSSGENLAWVDFRPLLNDAERFPNDVAVDANGNAYVTDSFAGVIYRVDPAGGAAVFLEHQSFSTQAALNGIVYHEPTNALIAVRVPDLIVIPLDNPAGFTMVQKDTPLPNADGLVLLDERTLVAVNNNPPRVYRFESDDNFASARATGVFEPGNVFPTTVAEREGEAYVLYSYLNAEEHVVTDFPIQHVAFSEMGAEMPEATPEATAEG